ncbi:putative receptor-like protein kinase At3g47110 [Magnolia sinica]|uniref:putative receptor-like protein kinase At3g47110 n=1 Tax=Magnolia sinica TaxID=86752 RepID=UPI00265B5256|nr:putative receptor-like protein kinase At3g47110 [Magnolia sinica]
MELLHVGLGLFCSFFLHALLLSSMLELSKSFNTLGNETDRLSLLVFKDGLTVDPFGATRSWNQTLHFCQWAGVTCSTSSGHQRVTALNFTSQRLVGHISPYISNLTFLKEIHLSNNSFHGKIPQEIGRLLHLQLLNLSHNSFNGEIPANLSYCSDLRVLDLHENQITGNLPTQLSSLSNLVLLDLDTNGFTGSIPPSFGNLSSLIRLNLRKNRLQGRIPHDLGRITTIIYLRISFNNLLGMLPLSLFNLSSINYFNVAANRLEGNLPHDIGLTLPNLQILVLGGNRFTGLFPRSLPNASRLESIDIADNDFDGSVPMNIGRLQHLWRLSFQMNRLGSGKEDDLNFLTSLTNCSGLQNLALGDNHFGGVLPNSIANLSTNLSYLYLGRNPISGRIPTGIENLVGLISLLMGDNLFEGTIPIGIGKLKNLKEFNLNGNRLSGQIPSSFGNITRLTQLSLYGNGLEGSIPSSFGNCWYLQNMDLSKNKLNGTVPKEVFSIPALRVFSLNENSLSGSLALEDNNLTNLEKLDVSKNKFSGEIPSTLGKCLRLENLYMSNNFFQGTIPPSLSNLTRLQGLDLSRNNLSGPIPEYFGKFPSLQYLNLSFNGLEGEVPKEGIFRNASAVVALGNNKLCGSVLELQLPTCRNQATKKKGRSVLLRAIISAASIASFVILCAFIFPTLYLIRKSRRKHSSMSLPDDPSNYLSDDSFLKVSYADLLQATDGFCSTNLIGMGSYGTVYKGVLSPDAVVAVKVLNLQRRGASRSFTAECEALRNIRHRNLIKILTACSSIDYKGNDFKALVFEYMPNGSLERWLHPSVDEKFYLRNLSLVDRLKISIDVAIALDYLHHRCQTPVIHCDLKPSNILLDDDMNAHVSDFGLARILYGNSGDRPQNQSSTIELKGSIGYISPEYGMGGRVSTHGDVYSYGILLLEMFTGKKPTDQMFKDGLSLHQLAKMALPDHVEHISDQRLILEENDEILESARNRMRECLVSVIKIGVFCSTELPKE